MAQYFIIKKNVLFFSSIYHIFFKYLIINIINNIIQYRIKYIIKFKMIYIIKYLINYQFYNLLYNNNQKYKSKLEKNQLK